MKLSTLSKLFMLSFHETKLFCEKLSRVVFVESEEMGRRGGGKVGDIGGGGGGGRERGWRIALSSYGFRAMLIF